MFQTAKDWMFPETFDEVMVAYSLLMSNGDYMVADGDVDPTTDT